MFLKAKKEKEIKDVNKNGTLDINRYFVPTSLIKLQNVSQFNLPGLNINNSSQVMPGKNPMSLCRCVYIEEVS